MWQDPLNVLNWSSLSHLLIYYRRREEKKVRLQNGVEKFKNKTVCGFFYGLRVETSTAECCRMSKIAFPPKPMRKLRFQWCETEIFFTVWFLAFQSLFQVLNHLLMLLKFSSSLFCSLESWYSSKIILLKLARKLNNWVRETCFFWLFFDWKFLPKNKSLSKWRKLYKKEQKKNHNYSYNMHVCTKLRPKKWWSRSPIFKTMLNFVL